MSLWFTKQEWTQHAQSFYIPSLKRFSGLCWRVWRVPISTRHLLEWWLAGAEKGDIPDPTSRQRGCSNQVTKQSPEDLRKMTIFLPLATCYLGVLVLPRESIELPAERPFEVSLLRKYIDHLLYYMLCVCGSNAHPQLWSSRLKVLTTA